MNEPDLHCIQLYPLCFLVIGLQHHELENLCYHHDKEDRMKEGK